VRRTVRPHPNIALVGKARSGKDTIANHLVEWYGYTRVAFADPLKDMALRLNPWISMPNPPYPDGATMRLADMVEHLGWDRAKDDFPEVRRILQECGQGVREIDPEFWIRAAMARIAKCRTPVVVSDCRYSNESITLARADFTVVRVTRPGGADTVTPEELANRQHSSEVEQDRIVTDRGIVNGSSLPALLRKVDELLV
jgi:hypothetical protein